MYLSKFTSVYKAIFVLLAVTVIVCAVELLFRLHQDLHYIVFPWLLSFFPPTAISWSCWVFLSSSHPQRGSSYYGEASGCVYEGEKGVRFEKRMIGWWMWLNGEFWGIYLKNGVIGKKSKKDLEHEDSVFNKKKRKKEKRVFI